jgi:hypothetical protein
MSAAVKTYPLSIRQDPKFAPQRHVFTGRRKIATITKCQYRTDWEVILRPSSIGSYHQTEAAALEFIRANEENYLSCMGGSVVVEYAK